MWLGRTRRGGVLAGFVLAAALVFLAASVAAPSSARSATACSLKWHPLPFALTGATALAVDSPTDAWSVGSQYPPTHASQHELRAIAHWNGRRWRISWHTGQSGWRIALNGVAAASPSAAWVVGARSNVSNGNLSYWPVIKHWDGTSWHSESIPGLPGQASLDGVVALAANDVWAVGSQAVSPANGYGSPVWTTLIVHWDGTAWTVTPSPNIGPATNVQTPQQRWEPASDNELLGIAAASPDSIWAVGEYELPVAAPGGQYYKSTFHALPLTEQWNGTQWSLGPPVPAKPSVEPGDVMRELHGRGLPGYGGFDAVAAPAPDDVIAIESPYGLRGSPTGAWRFSGSAWSRIVPARPKKFLPAAVTIPAPDDAWILGTDSGGAVNKAVHWNGQQWHYTRLPTPGAFGGGIFAAAADGADDIWATDSYGDFLHYTC